MNEENKNIQSAPEGAPASAAVASPAASEFFDWIHSIMLALIVCILIFVFVGRGVDVNGHSMNPTLTHEDRLVISNLLYTPKAGDIVVIRVPSYKNESLIKRVIATEGQTVDIDFELGIVYVDGNALEEDYVNDLTYTQLAFDGEITVPEGHIFVLGDNRNKSSDSRHALIGCVDVRCIIGKAYFRFFPFSGIGFVS